MGKEIALWSLRSPSCKPSFICVDIPLNEEVEVWLCAYPSFVRLIIIWLSAYPSKCRGDLSCALPLVRLYLREELCTPKLYLPKILSGGSLCGKSCVDKLVKILLCEGRDVELCARTSEHIFVFAFDPLSLILSLIVPCIDSYCPFILICLVLLVCVPHLC